MSKTFPTRPSVKTSRPVARNNQPISSKKTKSGTSSSSQSQDRARGGVGVGVGASFGASRIHPTVTSNNSKMQNNGPNIPNTRKSGFGGPESFSSPARPDRTRQESSCGEATSCQSGSSSSGFTVIPPNERNRQKFEQMGQRETEAYNRYLQSNKITQCNYVGTTGGGQMSEEEVRRKQANDVRNQKFNRLQNQQRLRQAQRDIEERDINIKKSEARRKAEENERRANGIQPSPEEIRRKRESFLRQLENQ